MRHENPQRIGAEAEKTMARLRKVANNLLDKYETTSEDGINHPEVILAALELYLTSINFKESQDIAQGIIMKYQDNGKDITP
jgi:hypothetical protein